MNNLKTVLYQLKSDKVKERQEGISSLRNVFARDSTVLSLDEAGDGRAWLVVFQALFTSVLNEKSALTKKSKNTSSAAAQRRLSDAAAAVRWLTERAVQRLNRKVVKPLLAHLIQTMVYQGELFMPVALDYIKAIRCIVEWTPHLEHLDEDTWVRIVEMGWNIVLGDPVRKSLSDDEPNANEESLGINEDDNDDMYMEDELEEDDEAIPSTPTRSAKRRRAPSATQHTPSQLKSSIKAKTNPSPSLEQIEYTSLLTLLLRFPSAPLLSSTTPQLASSLLTRLRRFIELYPTDTSMHHDYILSVSATLSHLALNKKADVTAFARSAWSGLVGLWGTKNKRMKEALVGVLRVLFPYFTATDDTSGSSSLKFDFSEGISKLWHLLDGEAESRWGIDGLSLDSLRLEVMSATEDEEKGAFVMDTFRAGWNFDAGQALTWAILELQADCAEKLFELSESIHSGATGSIKSEGKRARLENPITTLLYSIQTQLASHVRAFHMQTLLFFICRYWSKLHNSLQQDVISTLLQFVSTDDGTIQSWTFLCFAAITYADNLSPCSRDASTWDPIWTHAMRRANVPTVCRAACHAAQTLLSLLYLHPKSHAGSKRLLTSQRVLLEIETLAKDLDVQGPSFPYDSVCAFLAACLRVASQDVRLYRMQLEDKVAGWLMDCWRVGDARGDKSGMLLYTTRDMLLLLESICGFSKRSDLICRVFIPECLIVETMVGERKTKVIRDFLLSAKLPHYRGLMKKSGTAIAMAESRLPTGATVMGQVDVDLAPPRGRERRISAFMLKSLEALIAGWEVIQEANTHPSAEKARQSLDTAVIALSFESLLVLNGTKATRRVMQCGCKLVGLVTPLLVDSRWTLEEKALILLGLEPLTSDGEENTDETWEALVPPGKGTGIKTESSRALSTHVHPKATRVMRRDFQRILWRNVDVQDVLTTVMGNFRDVLSVIVGNKPNIGSGTHHAMDVDDKDGFAPIRTSHNIAQSVETGQQANSTHASRFVTAISIAFLATVPILQSSSGEPTRDKDMAELVLNSPGDAFLLVGPTYFEKVRQGILSISLNVLDNFLNKFETMLTQYGYSRSEKLQLLTTQFLDSTLKYWLKDAVSNSEVGEHIRALCRWLSQSLRGQKIRSWRSRDCVVRFLTRYIAEDAAQAIWSIPPADEKDPDEKPETLPVAMLPMLGGDEDIRIRFRVAGANASLFSAARKTGRDPSQLYLEIKEWLTKDILDYEHMLTRMLSLGNVMIVSSAVRRAPYFHLLEVVFYNSHFVHHVEAVLNGVSERMGLTALSELFEAYASQIAFSIRQADKDILSMPPHLLGYRGRRECAEATFRSFTPANIMAGGPSLEAMTHGQKLFSTHCKTIEKSPAEGIRNCFGDIVGYQIVFWSDGELNSPGGSLQSLEEHIKARTMLVHEQSGIDGLLQNSVDGIVAAILRTLGDQDFTVEGEIVQALRFAGKSEVTIQNFIDLTRFRKLDDVELHRPNLPTYSTLTILHAFSWLNKLVQDSNSCATTYHVLHQLFADVQNTPLINEQIRLLNGITLWVAIHHEDFKDSTLLHTLIHGSVTLLSQSDLARVAQSILHWAFRLYRRLERTDTRFSDALIRICCYAHDYTLKADDHDVVDLGVDLLRWIDDQALEICKIPSLRNQVVRALLAWPHQVSPNLTQISDEATFDSLSAFLGEARISSNIFRLVRRFSGFPTRGVYDGDKFSKTDFWRLKKCIPAVEQLQKEDVDAFTNLLVLHKGQIQSFSTEQPVSHSLRARHRRGNRKKDSRASGNDASPQRVIVQSLLAMLDGSTSTQVHVAYETLRFAMSLPSSDLLHVQSGLSEYRVELGYLQEYPRTPKTRPNRNLSELSTPAFDLDITATFPLWIAEITTLLSDMLVPMDSFYAQLTTVLRADIEFAEQVLPVLVHTLLQAELSQPKSPELSSRTRLSVYFTSILKWSSANVSCLRCIVDVVLHLRNFHPTNNNDASAHEKWLDIDFTLLSRNAVLCGAYTTALLFLELASEYRGSELEDATAEQILYEIYSHIDEPDGFYGIKTTDLRQFLIKRFHHENQWEKAFRFHGAALEASRANTNDAEGLLHSFHAFGFDHLAIDTMQSSHMGIESNADSSDMSYKLGWRTETWDLPDQRDEGNSGASLYLALRAVYRERDTHTIDAIIRHALFEEVSRLRTLGTENMAEIRQVIQNLMCLNQVTRWRSGDIRNSLEAKHIDTSEWAHFFDIDPRFEFSDLENIMATRISLIRSVRQKEQREQIGTLLAPFVRGLIEVEKKCLVRLSVAAREANQQQIALNAIVRAQGLEDVSTFEVSQEFARVLWLQKEQKLAVQFLKDLIGRTDEASSGLAEKERKASLLACLGGWSSEACLEKPLDISAHFFEPATSIANEIAMKLDEASNFDYATVYHQCALFAEHQYLSIVRSPDTIRWKMYVDRKTQEIKQRSDQIEKTQGSKDRSVLNRMQKQAEATLANDRELFEQNSGARDAFLEQAIDMYSRCLAASDAFDDDSAIRLCSLWFVNFHDLPLQKKVRSALDRVPSRKFVFLAHQLSARLSTSSSAILSNQQNLQSLVLRMCQEHPFHSLYQVYALRSETTEANPPAQPRRQSSRHELSSSQTDRASAAGGIFDRLRSDNLIGERIRAVELICNASLEWAMYPIQKDPRFDANHPKGPHRIAENLLIRKIENLPIPVVTSQTPLDPTLRYDNCVWIARFDKTFETAGGINLPKINICYGSNGDQFKQLFKGGSDDLRQDAVMEQVFELVNIVLRRDRETQKRALGVRGYKVVPLASQAGLLEFVGNTTPLTTWLTIAHNKYHPKESRAKQIMDALKAKRAECGGQVEPLLKFFLQIQTKVQPVMRHYFTEKRKKPMSWFAMRLNYTRSVATTSIVGHILGLGDRHVGNILIDNGSGEVVHIDLGIAFEQGKILNIPERVPFRMTRDMVDGMGTSGTQGVFQRCAEETLRVLRDRSDVIMTVLEVFKHDPLHSWTASELKIKRAQGNTVSTTTTYDSTRGLGGIGIDMSSGTADEAADRALSSVARKLDKTLSVEYTVNELIAEATDQINLATIFAGWSPFW